MFWRKRSAEDFAEEIKSHLELEADDLKREGMSEEESRWKARREFGNVRAAQEQFYINGRWLWLDKLLRDVRFGLRVLIKNKGFTAVAIFCACAWHWSHGWQCSALSGRRFSRLFPTPMRTNWWWSGPRSKGSGTQRELMTISSTWHKASRFNGWISTRGV